jgi:hypothetical protein
LFINDEEGVGGLTIFTKAVEVLVLLPPLVFGCVILFTSDEEGVGGLTIFTKAVEVGRVFLGGVWLGVGVDGLGLIHVPGLYHAIKKHLYS